MVIAVVLFFRKGLKGFFFIEVCYYTLFHYKALKYVLFRSAPSVTWFTDWQSIMKTRFFILLLLNQFYISMHYYGNKIYIFTLFNADFFYHQERIVRFLFYVRGWEVVLLIFHIKCFIQKTYCFAVCSQ